MKEIVIMNIKLSFRLTLLIIFTLTIIFSGCISQSSPEEVPIRKEKNTVMIQDSAGRYIEVPYPVERIVVLWDNPAEELRSLGAIDRIVGIDAETKKKILLARALVQEPKSSYLMSLQVVWT